MELEAFNIKFQHVSGKTNILADTLSRLVDIDPDVCEILSGDNVIRLDPDLQEPFIQQLTSPLTLDQLQVLQAQDEKCTTLADMLR